MSLSTWSNRDGRNSRMPAWRLLWLLAIVAGGALMWTSYLPRLLWEGAPKPVWPARGPFAEIDGGGIPPSRFSAVASSLGEGDWLQSLFTQYGGRAVLIYHNGELKLEHYARGFDAQSRFNSYSMVKSLLGVLVLKAVAEGLLNADEPIAWLLPEWENAAWGAVTVREFLDMRSGLRFESPADAAGGADSSWRSVNPFSPLVQLHFTGPSIIHKHVREPVDPIEGDGRRPFQYQNVNSVILGQLLERVYRMPLQRLLERKIWKPAGAGKAFWRKYSADDSVTAYCCLYARARDWLKVALFLSQNGAPDRPFLPLEMWREFFGDDLTKAQLRFGVYRDHVRHDVLDRPGEPVQGRFTYFAGRGGQRVYMLPDRHWVVIRFGERAQPLHSTLYAAWRAIQPGARRNP